MAILKQQLEDAGFDTAGLDEQDLVSKLDQAGFDTSSLTTQPSTTQSSVPPESKAKKFTRKVANLLPIAGGIGGSFVAPVAGTAAGAAAGEGVRQAILSSLGDQAPTLMEATIPVVKEAALGAAFAGGAKALGAGGKLIKNLITKPGAAEATLAGKEALAAISEKGAEKLGMARGVREAAKKGLIEAEEKAGLHFQSTPGFEELIKDPKKMAEFTQMIGRLAKRTPEELAQSIPSEQLQLFRKIAQEGEKISGLSDIAKSELRSGKDVVAQALGMTEKNIGEQLGRFREADKVVSEIPGQIKESLTRQKLQNTKDIFSAKELDKKRRIAKSLATGLAGYFGLKSIFK